MASTSARYSHNVNLNTTNVSELMRLEHLDVAGAKFILDRTARQPFADVNDAAVFISTAKNESRINLPEGTPKFVPYPNRGFEMIWKTEDTGGSAIVIPRRAPPGFEQHIYETAQSTTLNRANQPQGHSGRPFTNKRVRSILESNQALLNIPGGKPGKDYPIVAEPPRKTGKSLKTIWYHTDTSK
eukprot:768629_1